MHALITKHIIIYSIMAANLHQDIIVRCLTQGAVAHGTKTDFRKFHLL